MSFTGLRMSEANEYHQTPLAAAINQTSSLLQLLLAQGMAMVLYVMFMNLLPLDVRMLHHNAKFIEEV